MRPYRSKARRKAKNCQKLKCQVDFCFKVSFLSPTKPSYTPGSLFSPLQSVSPLYCTEVQLSCGWQCQAGQEIKRHFTGKEIVITSRHKEE